jgi:hypothetical protein
MRRNLATLALSLTFVGTCVADEPVLRVQSIKPATPGPAVLMQKRPSDTAPFPVTVNSTGYVKDHYITDKNTIAALEFLIGGRVGVNKDTDIEVVNERSVADGKTSVKRIVLKNGSLWVKADAKALKQPIEIQTNGGVMGIKGTEFTVENQADGSTRVCCFESNSDIGGVEIRDNNGQVVGVAKPGDEYVIKIKDAPYIKHYEDNSKFREDTLQRGFSDMQRDPIGSAFLGAVGSYSPIGVWGAYSAVNAFANIERDPGGAVLAAIDLANRAGANVPTGVSTPFGSFGVHSIPRNNKPPEPDFPSELAPDASDKSTQPKTAGPVPQFAWKGVSDAAGYVVLVGKDEEMYDVVYTERASGTSLNYPSYLRPLAPGKYFWRVVPVNNEDEPVQRGSQTFFMVQ